MRRLRCLAAVLGVTTLAAIVPVGAQAGIGGGERLCVHHSQGDPLIYMTFQEFILQRDQELRWVTVNNPCQGIAGIQLYHNKPPHLRVDEIDILPGMAVTIQESQIKAAGIKTKHLSEFGAGTSPESDPCTNSTPIAGVTRYIADAAGNVTRLVC